jgi:hypothetical protein
MSKISSNAILDKFRNRLSGLAHPTIPCILGPFKVHHVLCDWGASMNILPKMVYDYLNEDPLVPTPHQLRLANSVMMHPYGIAKDVLIEFQILQPWLISWSWIWILVGRPRSSLGSPS